MTSKEQKPTKKKQMKANIEVEKYIFLNVTEKTYRHVSKNVHFLCFTSYFSSKEAEIQADLVYQAQACKHMHAPPPTPEHPQS